VNLARDYLSLQEIEWLAGSSRHTRSGAQTEEARLHLGRCEFCQGLVKMDQELKAPGEERGGPNCPAESAWWYVVTGLLPESQPNCLNIQLAATPAPCYCVKQLRTSRTR
jgi:hypothetical protein